MTRALASLDGVSVGDAFGERFFGPHELVQPWVEQRILPRAPWGYTDDTEMTLSVVQVLEDHGHVDPDALALLFSKRYRRDKNRGYGGTAHDILWKLGLGLPWREVSSEVFEGQGSMGNGAAMRVAPLGAYFAGDLPRVVAEARASAEVTHMHPEGQAGAIAIAVAAVWCAARHLDSFEEALWCTVAGFGDRDTTCAMVGGIVALSAGRASIPAPWLSAREPLRRRV
ncbi:ADP-ribosylglycohydrolase family protein [Corallococcus interemptor]|uniref:ADP-ribosylglycohydrolase family protein n=1 Tax=Corallococcus interemptor TaxID=2316720 RepID=UPI0035D44151